MFCIPPAFKYFGNAVVFSENTNPPQKYLRIYNSAFSIMFFSIDENEELNSIM